MTRENLLHSPHPSFLPPPLPLSDRLSSPVSLVGLEGGVNVTRLGRFANYLRSILPHPDVTLTEMTAKAIGEGRGRGEDSRPLVRGGGGERGRKNRLWRKEEYRERCQLL